MSLNIRIDKVYIESQPTIECVCRVSYLNANGKRVKLGKVFIAQQQQQQQQKQDATIEMMVEENAMTSQQQQILVKVSLKSLVDNQIKSGDRLCFEFFHQAKLFERPFAVYEMLLDEMRESLKSKLETIINVDDHLIDYKTKLIRKVNSIFSSLYFLFCFVFF